MRRGVDEHCYRTSVTYVTDSRRLSFVSKLVRCVSSLEVTCSAVFLAFCLTSAAASAAHNDGASCSTGFFEVTASQGTQIQVLPTKHPDTCALVINGVRVELYAVSVARADRELNYSELQDRLRATTGAGRNPDVDVSLANIFSTFVFIGAGRIPYRTYSTPGYRRGYMLAPLNSNIAVIGTWIAPHDIPSNPLREAVSLTTRHGGSLTFWRILILKGVALLHLLWLLIPLFAVLRASELPGWANTYVPFSTLPGKLAIFVLVPGAMLGVAYFVLIQWGYSTIPILFTAIAIVAVLRTLKNAASFAGVRQGSFDLYFNDQPPIFQEITVNHREAEIEDIPIASSHFARIILWVPHKQRCQKCDESYVIHTASKAEMPITRSEYEARDIGRDKSTALTHEAAKKARAPVNGCPKCGTRSKEVIVAERNLRREVTIRPAVVKIVGGVAAFVVGSWLWMLLRIT